ncbi:MULTISPECIES: NAD(P)/FAD-dependent oxidoreductase [unclassified Caballeronia]|uniref:flavin-containing monooxygenase n=1 Tax=unclassified Caballeronia TaxID=2646786 RepID=UPI00285BB1E8|nr:MULTISPECIES: NAD(P)/FAD-dependent oxidoreductase [unclassified Caballeronia]MDR5771515.1 NAD(P)/FAD-dependent oxidoreductase [Caballeronia sp. LZ002]MDR5846951.1 NAD(P)/FAD-dependent oxidoreductase [Caballeronia sp. LZ003]
MNHRSSFINTVDTLVIGAGQAGLVTSYHLCSHGIEHLVIESEGRPAHKWTDRLWDSFTLVTPNWTFRIPGAEYDGTDPHGFMTKAEVAARFKAYVAKYQLPVLYNTRVLSVTAGVDDDFEVETNAGKMRAKQVVMATGLFQTPRIPSFERGFSSHVRQLHSSDYKNPEQLGRGAVLVVGSSQSGAQIADEINRSNRKVFLCVGESGRAPQRYRGKDSSEWLELLGLADKTVDQLMSPGIKFAANRFVGRSDGRDINLHRFHRDGITLLGRLMDVRNSTIYLAPDLHRNLKLADEFEKSLLEQIDQYIAEHRLDCESQRVTQWKDGFECEQLSSLDATREGIETVIWATGYRFDFSLVDFPVFDEDGYPVQKRGVTAQPGLYFVGLPWLYKQKSGLLGGVGDDAAHVVSEIVRRMSAVRHG